MPWNGGGTFSLNQNFPADRDAGAPDHFIDADKVDDEFTNVKGGLENCLTRTGETAPAGNTSWNGKKITALGDATNATDALNRQSGDARYAQLAGATYSGEQKFADGSVAAPSVSFASEPDCGAYYVSAGVIGFSINGSKIFEWDVNGATVTGRLRVTSDPTAGDHVGDRAYNDARYLLESNNGSDIPDKSAFRSNLGVGIGVHVQPFDADLSSIAALSTTSYGRNVLTQANAPSLRSHAGVGSMATRNYTASIAAPSGGSDGDVWFRYQ